ncbi:MAG: glycosyltransferase N-terminal domain-containing protein [Methyloligella sp. ZOD6]
MFKSLARSNRLVALAGWLGARYINLVYGTSRIRRMPDDLDQRLKDQDPQIFITWHGQFLLAPKMRPPWVPEVVAMVARHGDAEFIAETLKHFGTNFARGAGAGSRRKDRGGAKALREAVRALDRGATIVITADVPPGPARRASMGIVTMARLSGRPMVPFGMATKRYFAFNSWSKLTINFPFNTLGIAVGDPVWVPPNADEEEMERARAALENGLNETMAKAYGLAESDDPISDAYRLKRARPGFVLKAYRGLTSSAESLVPRLLDWREGKGKEEPSHRGERFGEASLPRPEGTLCWLHAASVGETNAALPLIEALKRHRPELNILLTTVTVTSAKLARRRLPEGAIHQYVPLDSPAYMRRFLDHWRPDLALLVESEIWPNLLLETKARGVPLVLINGRISKRSYKRWRRFKSFSRPLFSCFDLVLAQNASLGRQFMRLGAGEAIAVGNLKADAPPPPADLKGRPALEEALRRRPVFLASSTHPGEDELVAEAHEIAKRDLPDLITIIAPRHPDRGPGIAETLSKRGLKTALRSQGVLPGPETDIYIADTIGELGMLYALSPVALIGGSLKKKGGQNPVEAIKLGAAVLTGPGWSNFKDSYSQLLEAGGCREVGDPGAIAKEVVALLRNEKEREAMIGCAERCLNRMSGALDRTVKELARFLPDETETENET